jgi:hypothetical protein
LARKTDGGQSTVNNQQSAVDSQQSTGDSQQSTGDRRQATGDSQQSTGDRRQAALSRRVVIDEVRPVIDGGRFPIKRTPGEFVDVTAVLFADGHDVVVGVLRDRYLGAQGAQGAQGSPGAPNVWRETPLTLVNPGTDQWAGRFDETDIGWHEYSVAGWVDRFATCRRDLRTKFDAGVDVTLELIEGELLIREAAARADRIGTGSSDAAWLSTRADALSDTNPTDRRVSLLTADDVASLMHVYADRSAASESAVYRVWVDRQRARTGAWYEMFPRSAGPDPTRSEYLAKAGFTQSYTYFTWRNSKEELTEYFTGLAETGASEYLRPNLFANTPDILPEYLQQGGPPAFRARLLLAATLGANYGIYSGFELCENRPIRPSALIRSTCSTGSSVVRSACLASTGSAICWPTTPCTHGVESGTTCASTRRSARATC